MKVEAVMVHGCSCKLVWQNQPIPLLNDTMTIDRMESSSNSSDSFDDVHTSMRFTLHVCRDIAISLASF